MSVKYYDITKLDDRTGFRQALEAQLSQIEDGAHDIIRKTILDITRRLKQETPRLTGTAAYGWHVSAGAVSAWSPEPAKKYITKFDTGGVLKVNYDKKARNGFYYIQNNVSYIGILNKGGPHGTKGYAGFIDKVFAEWDLTFEQNKREAGFE
jgi:hypothetical protein